MERVEIKHGGRTVVSREEVPSVTGGTTTTVIKYDDGAYIECVTNLEGEVTVKSNKTFNIAADGKTIHLTD